MESLKYIIYMFAFQVISGNSFTKSVLLLNKMYHQFSSLQ